MCLWNINAPGRNKVKIRQKSLSPTFWPHPTPRGRWCQCEQLLDELTVQVWLLNHHPNFNWERDVSKMELQTEGQTNRQIEGRSDYLMDLSDQGIKSCFDHFYGCNPLSGSIEVNLRQGRLLPFQKLLDLHVMGSIFPLNQPIPYLYVSVSSPLAAFCWCWRGGRGRTSLSLRGGGGGGGGRQYSAPNQPIPYLYVSVSSPLAAFCWCWRGGRGRIFPSLTGRWIHPQSGTAARRETSLRHDYSARSTL